MWVTSLTERTVAPESPAEPPPDDGSGDGATQRQGTPQGGLRWEAYALCELVALCGFAVTQPVLDVVGRSPEFFVFHRTETPEVLLWLAIVMVAPPLVLWGLVTATRFAGHRVRETAQIVLVALLFGVFAVEVGKRLLPVRGIALVALAVVAAAAATFGYLKLRAIRSFLRVAAVGPLAFAMVFVFASPASAVVLGGQHATTPPAQVTGPHPPIVVLLLDEFPLVSLLDGSGKVDAKRFPNFAALSSESTWYRNATGVSGFTPYAVPALLSGRYPAEKAAPHYATYPDNMFSLLGQKYDVRAYETVTQMCRPRQCGPAGEAPGNGLPGVLRESADVLGQIVSPYQGKRDPTTGYREPTLRERRGDVNTSRNGATFAFERLGENQPARFLDFANGLRPTSTPTVHFLHLLLPHAPFHYLPSGTKYNAPLDVPNDTAQGLRLTRERHLLQVEYADRLLGETLRVMRDSGLYDKAALFVTADHGVSFTPGASGRGLDADQRAAAELMWVPMFVKGPGQTAGHVDDRNWEQVDLLPTVADYAGLSVPWRQDGLSGRAKSRDRTVKYFFNEIGDRREVDGPRHLASVVASAVPPLPAAPLPTLVGKSLDQLHTTDDGPAATVENLDDFRDVRFDGSTIPALVHGTLPDQISDGTPLVIALNGRVGAVAVALTDGDTRRFAGLITDESLFVPHANRLELFAADGDGTAFQRMHLNGP